MSIQEEVNFLKKLFGTFIPRTRMEPKRKVTEFVKKQRELNARLMPKYLWLSRHPKTGLGLTYVRRLHGELR